ncbi:MAG: serine/threonine-protein kinase [Acidobacteriota bacterium]|nr:serine/threonine-protein kinase [Acidobacteriota bacterium]
MTFAPGTKQGAYEILGPLGAGGMGEVYRARDTRLHRDVAIKALPSSLSNDPERLARFEREARLLAALNHPNVAAIYGLEEADGSPYLVMECVEGETLSARLAAGPLPVEDALAVAVQIAAGVAAAHEAGVIHRDLKPANVMVRPDGSVKVLDLGLARSVEASATGDPSLSPTVTSGATGTGVILGTAAYMSPEQARGRPVDKRTDVFSFGCVLYECLTGQRAFPGDTVSDSLAAILRAEPDWDALPANTPVAIRRLLARALRKDPKRRLQDMADTRNELEDAIAAPRAPTVETLPVRPWRQSAVLPWALGGALVGAIIALLATRSFGPASPRASPPLRAVLPLPAGTELVTLGRPNVAISPDGRTVIFGAAGPDGPRLYRRSLDRPEAEPIAGTDGGFSPFFSPDGEWLGFFTRTELKKVPLAGGAPISLTLVPPVTSGGAWGNDGHIVFTGVFNGPLMRISEAGGKFEFVSTLDAARGEHAHLWPQILPEGRGILVTIVLGQDFQDYGNAQIAVLDLKSGRRTVVLEGSPFARYAAGQIVFVRGGSVFRAPFDLSKLRVTAPPVALPERVAIEAGNGVASFAITADGAIVYADGPPVVEPPTTVFRLDRDGRETPLPLPEGVYSYPRLSPDGTRLALQKCAGESCKIFLYDLHRNVLSPFTSEPGRFFSPVWSPDGSRLAYSGLTTGNPTLYVKNTDGSGQPVRLTDAAMAEFPNSWSPDGRTLVYVGVTGGQRLNRDIWFVSLDGKRNARPWFESPHNENAASFSPDGRWIAYVSDESGRQEVYVRPLPGPGGSTKISSEGGSEPVWTRGGRELLYRQANQFLAVEIRTEPVFAVGRPRVLFSGDYLPGGREDAPFGYDVSRDGNEIYAVRTVPAPEPERRLAIVTNWLQAIAASDAAK